jgi:alkylhydroperoxidase family enzyme
LLLADVAWEPPLLEPRRDAELERWVRRELGMVPGFVPYLAACPWLVRALLDTALSERLLHLDLELGELAFLVVSQDNSCRYCYAETRAILRLLGVPLRRIERMEQDLFTSEIGPGGRRALDVARRLSRANPLPSAADLAALEGAGLAREAVLEVLFAAATAVAANRVATIPALPAEEAERAPERLSFRLLRPLRGQLLLARRRRVRPQRLAPEQRDGPFAAAVLPFDGLPAGPALRRILDACWSATGLAPGTRALVFAVVARGLGAAAAEREALRLAGRSGIAPQAAEQALRHLAAPSAYGVGTPEGLRRAEAPDAQALSFARETLWYEPARIQRRARALRDALGPERFLDLVGTAAVANAICRLSAVLEPA